MSDIPEIAIPKALIGEKTIRCGVCAQLWPERYIRKNQGRQVCPYDDDDHDKDRSVSRKTGSRSE